MQIDIHSLWQAQPLYLQPPTPENLRRRARQLRIERLAALSALPFLFVVSAVFALAAIFGDILLCRIGCAISAASLFYTTCRFVRSEWSYDLATECAAHYRAQLTKRIAYLRSFTHHDALPISVGIVIATIGWHLAEPHHGLEALARGVFGIALQFAVSSSNMRRIARLQKELESLNAAS